VKLSTTLRALSGDKVGAAIADLHDRESSLASALRALSDQHKADHEVFHVARDLAAWSSEHVRRLAEVGTDYGVDLDAEGERDGTLVGRIKQKGAELASRRPEPGLLLLVQLREVHLDAAAVSLDWEVLAQAAQAMKDAELLSAAQDCHPETLRQLRWANAKVKELSVQAMVVG
jgi:hypothetical protein